MLLKRSFRPEFLNRLDEVIYFKPLSRENIRAIVDLAEASLAKRLAEMRLAVRLTDRAKDFIGESAYDPVYGARPLGRFMSSKVETLIARKIIKDNLSPDSSLIVDEENGELVVALEK